MSAGETASVSCQCAAHCRRKTRYAVVVLFFPMAKPASVSADKKARLTPGFEWTSRNERGQTANEPADLRTINMASSSDCS